MCCHSVSCPLERHHDGTVYCFCDIKLRLREDGKRKNCLIIIGVQKYLFRGTRTVPSTTRHSSLFSRGSHRQLSILSPQPRRPLTVFSNFRCEGRNFESTWYDTCRSKRSRQWHKSLILRVFKQDSEQEALATKSRVIRRREPLDERKTKGEHAVCYGHGTRHCEKPGCVSHDRFTLTACCNLHVEPFRRPLLREVLVLIRRHDLPS